MNEWLFSSNVYGDIEAAVERTHEHMIKRANTELLLRQSRNIRRISISSGDTDMTDETTQTTAVELATELTIAWLTNPNTRANADEVPSFLKAMHDAVSGLSSETPEPEASTPVSEHVPAVTARKSLSSREHIISMIDGKPYKSLKRHLKTHGLTPAEYRQRYGLKPDYPMVAPDYAERRREMAKKIGLGRRPRQPAPEGEPQASPPRRSRRTAKK